jgi:hypothetical protein
MSKSGPENRPGIGPENGTESWPGKVKIKRGEKQIENRKFSH